MRALACPGLARRVHAGLPAHPVHVPHRSLPRTTTLDALQTKTSTALGAWAQGVVVAACSLCAALHRRSQQPQRLHELPP